MRLPIRGPVDPDNVSTLEAAIPRLDSAIQVALQSDTLRWERPEWIAIIRLYTLKGYCHEHQDQFLDAKQAYEAGLSLAERFGIQNPDIVYSLYGPLGNVYSRLEETEQASLLIERCIHLLRDSLAFGKAARRSIDWGISFQSRGLLKQGIDVLFEALAFRANSEDTRAGLHEIMTGILLDSFELAPNAVLLRQATSQADSAYHWFRVAYGQESHFEERVSDLVWLMGRLASLRGDWAAS